MEKKRFFILLSLVAAAVLFLNCSFGNVFESFVDGSVNYLVSSNEEIQKDVESKKLINVDNHWLYTPNVGKDGYKPVNENHANVITEATTKAYSLDTPWETISENV
jgi:hypothetical protein